MCLYNLGKQLLQCQVEIGFESLVNEAVRRRDEQDHDARIAFRRIFKMLRRRKLDVGLTQQHSSSSCTTSRSASLCKKQRCVECGLVQRMVCVACQGDMMGFTVS